MDYGPEPRSSRRLGFTEARSALEDLVGSQVGVEVSAQGEAAPFLTLIGPLDRVWEVGQPGRGALALQIEDAIFRISRGTFTAATCEEYVDEAESLRWRLVAIELRSGVVIEVEEIPSGRCAHP